MTTRHDDQPGNHHINPADPAPTHDPNHPVGTRVRYHGSQRDHHGEYTVLSYCWDWFGIGWRDGRSAAWHDGCALCGDDAHDRYVLAKTSATRITGLLDHVRRTSFTVIEVGA